MLYKNTLNNPRIPVGARQTGPYKKTLGSDLKPLHLLIGIDSSLLELCLWALELCFGLIAFLFHPVRGSVVSLTVSNLASALTGWISSFVWQVTVPRIAISSASPPAWSAFSTNSHPERTTA
jgi:hypothetical protein